MTISESLSGATMRAFAPMLQRNFVMNLAAIRAARGVDQVRNSWRLRPIVVTGAGPSLTKAIPFIRMSKTPVIACARAVRPLMKAGIIPAWAVFSEIHPTSISVFDDVKGLESVPLVFDPFSDPDTVRDYPGDKWTYDRPKPLTGKGPLRLGTGNVTYAVGLAEVLGAQPIILAGVDLTVGTYAHGVQTIPDPSNEKPLKIKGVQGDMIESSDARYANVEELAQAAEEGLHLVQTSDYGAYIPGALHAPIEGVL